MDDWEQADEPGEMHHSFWSSEDASDAASLRSSTHSQPMQTSPRIATCPASIPQPYNGFNNTSSSMSDQHEMAIAQSPRQTPQDVSHVHVLSAGIAAEVARSPPEAPQSQIRVVVQENPFTNLLRTLCQVESGGLGLGDRRTSASRKGKLTPHSRRSTRSSGTLAVVNEHTAEGVRFPAQASDSQMQ